MYNVNFICLNPIIGGQEIYLINIIKQLKKYYQVVVYTKLDIWHHSELINIDGITLQDIGHISYNKFFTIKYNILNASSKEDIFIFNGNRAIYLGSLFSNRYKKIAIQHSSLYDKQDGLFKKNIRHILYKFILQRYDKLIGISKHSIKPLIAQEKVEVILNGVDTNKFYNTSKPNNLVEKYKFKSDDKIILMIGVLNDNKGQLEALEILKYLDANYKLIIVGDGEDRSKIEQYIQKKSLQQRVFMVGKILDVRSYYNLADVLLFMSKHEGLPLTILEAMACGVPVVTTNVGGISEVVENEVTGIFINRDDKRDIANKIKKLCENTTFRDQLLKEAQYLIENLTWEKHVSKLITIIEDIKK